jgi:tetratricopeptide (TPR) repeat protein
MRTQAIVLTLVLGCGVARAALPDDALIDSGSQKLQSGDIDGALDAFRRAEKLSPKDARPKYLQAVALQKKGDLAGAEQGFKSALALEPKHAEVRNELGALYNERRRYAEAASELERAVADKPDLAEGWFNLGQARLGLKQCPQALASFERVTKLEPTDGDGWINLSVAQRKCGQPPAAVAAARQAVKLSAASAPAHLNLGLSLEEAGKLDDAANEFTVATRIKSDYATAWWSLGLVELKRKRADAAIAALGRARELSPTAARITDLGVAYRDKGDLARAAQLFGEALAKDPRYVPAHWHLAQTLAAQHRCADMGKELAALPPPEQKGEAAQKLRQSCK